MYFLHANIFQTTLTFNFYFFLAVCCRSDDLKSTLCKLNNVMQYNDHAQICWETSCVCRTVPRSLDTRNNWVTCVQARSHCNFRTSFARLPYEFVRQPYQFVWQPCDLNKSQADRKKNGHVEILLATLRSIARHCKFVRQPYDLLRIPCVSNRKRLQGCRRLM